MSAARRGCGERGSVSLLVVIMVPALLMAGGLVLDGGRQLQARRDARARPRPRPAPASICRSPSSTPVTSIRGLRSSGPPPSCGVQGARGSVSVVGDVVTVTVSADVDYLILPGTRTVSSSSSATAQRGVVQAGDVP